MCGCLFVVDCAMLNGLCVLCVVRVCVCVVFEVYCMISSGLSGCVCACFMCLCMNVCVVCALLCDGQWFVCAVLRSLSPLCLCACVLCIDMCAFCL